MNISFIFKTIRIALPLWLALAANFAIGQTDSCIITTLPYIQDFEDCEADLDIGNGIYTGIYEPIIHSSFVPCWRKMGDTLALPWRSIYIRADYDGKRLAWGNKSDTSGWQYLVLPKVDSRLCPANGLALRFSFDRPITPPKMRIGILGDPDDLTTLDTMPVLLNGWNDTVLTLDGFSRTDGHIVLMWNANRYSGNLGLDNVVIDRADSCGYVCDVRAGEISSTGAVLRWSRMGADSSIERRSQVQIYRHRDTTLVQSFVCDTDAYFIRHLEPMTEYLVRVTPSCDDANPRIGSERLFTTAQPETDCPPPYVRLAAAGGDSATVEWAAGNIDSSWTLYWRRAGEAERTLADSNVTEMQYTFLGLQPSTRYFLIVENECDMRYSHSVTVMTPCQAIDTLPYRDNFDEMDAQQTCWTLLDEARPQFNSAANKTSLYIESGLAILPEIEQPLNTLTLTLTLAGAHDDRTQIIGVITDVNDTNSFIPYDTIVAPYPISITTEVCFDRYGGPEGRIAIKGTCGTYLGMGARYDSLTVCSTAYCQRPGQIDISSVTASSAMVDWNPIGHARSYEIEYGLSGFAHGEGMTTGCFDDSILLAGLRHSTPYDLYIRSHCGDGDTSEWSPVRHFITACGSIDTLPYFEDFSHWGISDVAYNILVHPACWDVGSTSYYYANYPVINSLTHDGKQDTVLTVNSANGYLVALPMLDSLIGIAGTHITLKAWSTSDLSRYSPTIIAGAGSTPRSMATFVPTDTLRLSNTPQYFDIRFNDISGTERYAELLFYGQCYIDSITWEMLPNCQRPTWLRATHIDSTHATLRWRELSGATQWQIEYGPHGFALGNGTRMTVASDTVTLGGLLPSTRFDCYVRSICATGDTSLWTLQPCTFTTTQTPARIPYITGFEETDDTLWQATSSAAANWYRGTYIDGSTYNYYISADSGATVFSDHQNQYINATTYRDIDFGNLDTTFTLTVKVRHISGARTTVPNLAIMNVNPAAEVNNSPSQETTPWGYRDSVANIALLNTTSSWTTHSFELGPIHGVRRIAFFWCCNGYLNMPVAIDDISITYTLCPKPYNLHTTAIGSRTADVTWTGYGNSQFVVINNYSGNPIDTVNTNHISLSGLTPATQYSISVYKLCDGYGVSNISEDFVFTTRSCDDGITDTIGDSTSTKVSDLLPFKSNSKYSYTQQIIRADELDGAGEVTAIGLQLRTDRSRYTRNNCAIYMGHTDWNSFNDNGFFDPVQMELVYLGSLQCKNGWSNIMLDSPFDYNGTSNIVIAIDDNSGARDFDVAFYCDDVTDGNNLAITCFSNELNPQPRSLVHIANFNGSHALVPKRSHLSLDICPPSTCSKPQLKAPYLRYSRAMLRWHDDGAEEYTVQYKMTTANSWHSQIIRDTSYTINDIIPTIEYIYRIRRDCDSLETSGWAYGLFRTADMGCQPPENLHLDALNSHSAWLRWTPDGNNIGYHVHVFNSWFDTTLVCYIANDTIGDLLPGITYYAAVKASCDECDEMSTWSDTISFVMPTCPNATDLAYSDLQGNSVVLDWAADTGSTLWEIQYGLQGFAQGTGTTIYADHHPFSLDRLTGETTYDAYVRTICGTDFYSEHWSNAVTFTTLWSDIDDVAADHCTFRITPNPADNRIHLISSEESIYAAGTDISIRNALGKEVQRCRAPQSESQSIDISTLSAGIYFVTITTPSGSSSTKLIVQ